MVRLHSVAGASPLGLVLPSDDPGTQVAFHPDGRRFLTGDAAGVVRLWDPASCQSGHRDLPHDGEISDMAVTGDGSRLATASEDGKCQMWSTDDGLPVGQPMLHESSVFRVVFNRDGRLLATASTDQTAKIWDGRTAALLASYAHESPVVRIAFHPQRDQIATGTLDGRVTIWDYGRADPLMQTAPRDSKVLSMTYSLDGSRLGAGFLDGSLVSIDLALQTSLDTRMPGGQPIEQLDFLERPSRWVTGGSAREIRFWDPLDLRTQGPVLPHLATVKGMSFASDTALVVADASGKITHWEQDDGAWAVQWERSLPATWLNHAQIQPRTTYVGVGGTRTGAVNETFAWGRGFAAIYDLESQTAVTPRLPHFDEVSQVLFDPQGRYLATASNDQTASLWELIPTDLDIDFLTTLSVLYTSHEFNDRDQLAMVPARQLEQRFREAIARAPDSFRCRDSQIATWQTWLQRLEKGRSRQP